MLSFIQMWIVNTEEEFEFDIEQIVELEITNAALFVDEIVAEVAEHVGEGEYQCLVQVKTDVSRTNGPDNDWDSELVSVEVVAYMPVGEEG